MASDNPKGAIEAALTSSWRTATRTPIVVVPATLAALAWALALAAVRNAETAPDGLIFASFAALYVTTIGSVIAITTRAAARLGVGPSRTFPAVLTAVILSVVVAAATLALRSFLAAWFGCALLFLYALPLVAAGNHNVLGSFYASAHLAVRRFGTTVLAAVMIEIIGVFALGAASVLSGLPFAGQFLQSLVLQLAIGFFAVFALEQFLAVRAVENRVPILAPVFRPEVTP